jgi:hypothetical protein
MTLVWCPNRVVGRSYMILEGEIISVAGWSDLVNWQALLPIGDTSMLMLFYGSLGFFYLFFMFLLCLQKNKDVLRQLLI